MLNVLRELNLFKPHTPKSGYSKILVYGDEWSGYVILLTGEI
jgi:hypothetical protein